MFVVALCVLLGVSHSSSESVCVLSDAPQQCGAFSLAAWHPLHAQSRQLENSQEAIVKMIADSRAEQKEFLNHYYQTARKLLNVHAENRAAKSSFESIPVQICEKAEPEYMEDISTDIIELKYVCPEGRKDCFRNTITKFADPENAKIPK